jgi:hypothetical protein
MPSPLQRLRSLGRAVEQSIKQHRWVLRQGHSKRVRHYWTHLSRETAPSNGKRCLLDLRRIACDGEQGRRFHALVRMLERGGYEVSMVPRLQFLQTGDRVFKRSALASIEPFDGQQGTPPFSSFDLCLSDSPRQNPYSRRTIQVLTGTRDPLASSDLAMPYSVFPAVWDQRDDDRFEDYRRQQRVWRLFFGGHCSRESYRRITKYTRLRPVDRYNVIREVNRYFAGSTLEIGSDEQLQSASASRHESFVMIDNAKYRTESEKWLQLLSQSDFFLAAPGCDYPLSHNAIESIAVGTIPVLEYDSLFTPELRDGINCIAYRNLDGLRRAMARIEAMPRDEITKLRASVIDYYENHLSPAAFCRQLEDPRNQRLHLFAYLTPAANRAA